MRTIFIRIRLQLELKPFFEAQKDAETIVKKKEGWIFLWRCVSFSSGIEYLC